MSALACAAMAACSPFGEPGGPAAEVTVSIVPDRYSQTRSSFTWNEDEIRDIQVVVTTESGEIHDILYSDSPSGLHFTGQAGSLYKLWTAANIGGKVEASSLEDFTEGIRHVSKAGIERTGIPMYSDGAVGILLAEGENHATIPLTRMMARVDFSVDKQYLEYPYGFSISSVRIISPVDAYVPFSGNVMKTGGDGNGQSIDNASRQDIRLLNRGGTISLYTFENMQGTLLHGNTDPWRKVPDIIGGTARNCTYLEVTCSYTTESDSCDDITYRMYLGEDATTNFDVKRNTIYRLTLEPTEEEIRGGRGSWKIETGEWEDFPEEPVYSTEYEYELVVSPESTTLTEGETVPFTATYITREYTLADGVRISDEPTSTTEDDVTEMANWTVRSGSQYVSNQGDGVFGWAFESGTAVVDATFGGCMDSAEINTLAHQIIYSTEYEYELVVSPESATLAEGETVSFTAVYITREYTLADGERISDVPTNTTEDDVTEMSNWSVRSGSQYVDVQGSGVFGWISGPGTAVIQASFDGCTDNAEINTLAHQVNYSTEYEYELVVSPGSATLAEGETVSFSATYITREYALADGERISDMPTATTEDDVTEMANWTVRSGAQYVNKQGDGVFGWVSGPGIAIVDATFGGCTDTAGINTLAHQIVYSTEYEYELVVSPESASLAEGETVSFSATYITREYTLADGERISDVPTATTEDDVTEMANWTVKSGSQYIDNHGEGIFGWVSGPGTAVIEATHGGYSDTAIIDTGAPTPIEPTVESIEILELTNNGTGITSGNRYSYHLKCIVTMSDGTTYESTDPNDAPDFEWWSPDEGHGVTTGTDGWFDVNAQTDGDLVMSCTYEHEFSADFVVEVTEPTVVSMVLEEISGNGQTIHFSQAQYIYKATVTLSDGTVIESTDAAHRNDFEWDACLYGTGTGSYGITSVGYGRYHVQGWLDTGDTGYEISCTYGGETRYEYIFVSASGLDYSHDGYREDGSQYDTLHVYVTLECDGETVQLEVPYLNGLEVGNGYYRFQISYDCLENGYWTGCTDTVPHGTTARYNFSVSVNGGSYSTDPPSSL